jgi:hypothetical protein
MRAVDRKTFVEYHPETAEDFERLRRAYPNLTPSPYIAVAKKPPEPTILSMRDMYLPRTTSP